MLSNWFSKNRAVDQYRRYRLAGKELNHKIMRAFVDDAVIETAARTLGLWKQKRLVLGTEDDTSVLMDFGLYEVPRQGRQLVKRYQEEKGGSNEVERDLLAAMIEATTGLFEVKQIYRRKCQLDLRELVGGVRTLSLTDINFSQFAYPGLLLFFRPIELPQFTMSSGVAFVFPGKMAEKLNQRWEKSNGAERYARFFKLSKTAGVPIQYA